MDHLVLTCHCAIRSNNFDFRLACFFFLLHKWHVCQVEHVFFFWVDWNAAIIIIYWIDFLLFPHHSTRAWTCVYIDSKLEMAMTLLSIEAGLFCVVRLVESAVRWISNHKHLLISLWSLATVRWRLALTTVQYGETFRSADLLFAWRINTVVFGLHNHALVLTNRWHSGSSWWPTAIVVRILLPQALTVFCGRQHRRLDVLCLVEGA